MRRFWTNLKKWQKIWIIVGAFVIVVGVVVGVVLLNVDEPNVTIKFDSSVNIPTNELKTARRKLVSVIRDNTVDYNKDIVYEGYARDYTETKNNDITVANFIVDFDDIKESYAVDLSWPNPDDGSPNVFVSCPLLKSKYPNTPCKTEANFSTEITSYLPYYGKLADGKEYKIVAEYYKGNFCLETQVTSHDENILNEAVAATKEWVSSIGFNPDDYTYKISEYNTGDKTLTFYNQDILVEAYNADFAKIVLDDITNVVLTDNANLQDYTATIDVASFYSSGPYESGFRVDISDGRKYDVTTKTDSLEDNFTYINITISRDGETFVFDERNN